MCQVDDATIELAIRDGGQWERVFAKALKKERARSRRLLKAVKWYTLHFRGFKGYINELKKDEKRLALLISILWDHGLKCGDSVWTKARGPLRQWLDERMSPRRRGDD